MTTSDYSWLRVLTSQTKSDCDSYYEYYKWLRVTTSQTSSNFERLQVTTSDYKWLRLKRETVMILERLITSQARN